MTRSRLLGLGLAVVASSALVVSPLPAAAEEVPAATAYTVTGYGYGHGHGLSQYGAQGAANQGLSWKQIVGFYYPGTRLGRAARHPQGAHHRGQEGRHGRRPRRASAHAADRTQDLHPGQGASEGDALADHAAGLEERGLLPRSRPRRLAEVDDVPGCRRVLGRQPAADTPAAEARVRGVPRRASVGREAHGQRAAAGPLPAGRRPTRGPGGVAGPGGPGPGGGGSHVRRVRAGDRDVVLRHLRHRVVPGLRRSGRRAPGVQRCGEGDARQGRALPGPAGLHPVLLEQRRLQLGRFAALPGRPARSLRSVLGQPQRPLDGHRHARQDREDVARGRHPCEPVVQPGRARRPVRRPGHVGDPHRHPGRPASSRSPATTSGSCSG